MLVRALSKGHFGGMIRELGHKFDVPDEVMKDATRRPRWVEPVKDEDKAALAPTAPAGKGRAPKGNGVVEALGGVAPDWVPKDAQGGSK